MTEEHNHVEMTEPDAAKERDAIVRFCLRYTGDAAEAEDLTQQTLTLAWVHRAQLRDQARRLSWLFGIARNVCAAWARDRAPYQAEEIEGLLSLATDPGGEVETADVADLLDRALRRLSPATREILTQRYIQDVSQSDVAAALGISEGAVEGRVHRGKASLRRLLTTEFRTEAIHLGLVEGEDDRWRETRILCPFCGATRLFAQLDREQGFISYRCSNNCVPGGTVIGAAGMDGWSRLTSPKAILTRALATLHHHYEASMQAKGHHCSGCGAWVQIDHLRHAEGSEAGIQMHCIQCGHSDAASLWHLALDTPAAQIFWRRHPRMRALPTLHVEGSEHAVIKGGFESPTSGERLEILFDPASYRVLGTAP